MPSTAPPKRSLATALLINFIAPIGILSGAVLIFLQLGTVEPPKRPSDDMSRAGKLRALPPIRVETVKALNTNKTPLFLTVDGTVVPFEESNVAAEVSGRIIEKSEYCEPGCVVKKGDLLMRIDKKDYEIEVRRFDQLQKQEYQRLQEVDQEMINSQRLIKVAEQDVALQQKEIERLKALPAGFASQTEIDQANRAALAATQQLISLQNQLDLQKKQRTRIEAAEKLAGAQLEMAQLNLDRTTIRAPIDGVVVNEKVDLNTFVTRGSPLLTIENTSKVEVSTNLRMDQLYWILDQSEVTPNTSALSYDLPETDAIVEYEISGRRQMVHRWKGKLLSYDGIGLDPKTRTVPVRVIVDEPSRFFGSTETETTPRSTTPLVRGMFVRVQFLIKPKTKLYMIPTKAMQPGNRVYQFTPDESVLWERIENLPSDLPQGASIDDAETDGFNPKEWQPGRVSIRDSVIPVNSLKIASDENSSIDELNHNSTNLAVGTQEFWVCEVVGIGSNAVEYVVTSPLGTLTELSFPARIQSIQTNDDFQPLPPEQSKTPDKTPQPSDAKQLGFRHGLQAIGEPTS